MQLWRYSDLPIYIPRLTYWRFRRGKTYKRIAYQMQSMWSGVYCVIGYVKPDDVPACKNAGLSFVAQDAYLIPIKEQYVINAKQSEEESKINPYQPVVFKCGEIVESLDWFLNNRQFRVIKSNPEETVCNDCDTGRRLTVRTLRLKLSTS